MKISPSEHYTELEDNAFYDTYIIIVLTVFIRN